MLGILLTTSVSMRKTRTRAGNGVAKLAPTVVSLSPAIGKQLSLAPILVIGLLISGFYFSEASEKRARAFVALEQNDGLSDDSSAARQRLSKAIETYSKLIDARQATVERFNTEISQSQTNLDLQAHAYSSRGSYYEAEGQWRKALADYSVALSASSEPVSVHYTDCGRMCTKLGDFDKAITYFSKALLQKSDINS